MTDPNPGQVSAAETEAMAKSAVAFGDAVNACQSVLTGINNMLMGMGISWKGQAAKEFGQVMDQWIIQFDKVVKSLDYMKDTLNQSAVHYGENEYEQAQISTEFSSVLNQR